MIDNTALLFKLIDDVGAYRGALATGKDEHFSCDALIKELVGRIDHHAGPGIDIAQEGDGIPCHQSRTASAAAGNLMTFNFHSYLLPRTTSMHSSRLPRPAATPASPGR